MPSSSTASRPAPAEVAPAEFTTVGDGVRAQLVTTRLLLPPHLSSSAHEGRSASCRCRPLLEQLTTARSWPVVPRGARAACVATSATLAEEHELQPLRHALWLGAPAALMDQAHEGRVELFLTMCAYCGAVEVRDVSFHQLGGLRASTLAPRRRSNVLGWYAGKRPAGRIYT